MSLAFIVSTEGLEAGARWMPWSENVGFPDRHVTMTCTSLFVADLFIDSQNFACDCVF
jgi:hypothetical protein